MSRGQKITRGFAQKGYTMLFWNFDSFWWHMILILYYIIKHLHVHVHLQGAKMTVVDILEIRYIKRPGPNVQMD